MAFTRVNVTGWVDGDLLSAAQINALDVDHARAVDGLNGGTYSLGSPLTINGAAFNINSALSVGGTAQFGAASQFSANVVFGAVTQFNGAAQFNAQPQLTGTLRLALASRSITRVLDGAPNLWVPGNWTVQGASYQTSTGLSIIDWPLHIPHGATLTEVALLIGTSAHASWPPTTPHHCQVAKTSIAGTSTVANWDDSTGSQSAYEAVHWLSSGPLSELIDRTSARYTLSTLTEVAGGETTTVYAARVTYTTTAYDED